MSARVALRAAVLSTLVLGVPMYAAGSPAAAHPGGTPSSAHVDVSDAHSVTVEWRAGMADDLSYLAAALGVLPDERIMLDGAVFTEEGDEQVLRESPEFSEYALARISVSDAGRSCPGSVAKVGNLLTHGVVVAFECAEPTTAPDVRIAMLTDLSPEYVTLAPRADAAAAMYDGDHPVHTWPREGTDGPRFASLLYAVPAVAFAALARVIYVLRRKDVVRTPHANTKNPTRK